MEAETPNNSSPIVEKKKRPYALFASAIGAQIMTICFSLGLLYWVSPIICLVTISVMTLYIFHLSWIMGMKHTNAIWKLLIFITMFINILWSLSILYFLELD